MSQNDVIKNVKFQRLSIFGGQRVVRECDGDAAVDVAEEQKEAGRTPRFVVGRDSDFTKGTGKMITFTTTQKAG